MSDASLLRLSIGAMSVVLCLSGCGMDRADRLMAGSSSVLQQGETAVAPARSGPAKPVFPVPNRASPTARGFEQIGTDRLVQQPVTAHAFDAGTEARDITISLVDSPVTSAADAILGRELGVSYTVDPEVTGAVTLQTGRPVSRRELLSLFEAALADVGGIIEAANGIYRVLPASKARTRSAAPEVDLPDPTLPGTRTNVITLRYASASELQSVLAPILPEGTIAHVDTLRNALLVRGNASEIAEVREAVSIFDVDRMKGMSFALVPVRSASPTAIADELDQIFGSRTGALRDVVRFVPNNRLKSVLIVSSRSSYVGEARLWIKRLDVLSSTNEKRLHVYRVQNRTAAEIASILERVLASQTGRLLAGEVAPEYRATVVNAPGSGAVEGGPETPVEGIDVVPRQSSEDYSGNGGEAMTEAASLQRPRIVADESNNALLILASDSEFDRIRDVLAEIDTVPNQVLLEAVIAEVALDDDLRFGVRWFLGERGRNQGVFSDAVDGAVSSVFPGFSYFLKSSDIGLTLNAISSVTDVRVLSAPSLVVLDNKSATLQVGDQVPVVTQSARSVASADSPVVNNVELKDTGVILNVTPRVNEGGLVTLEVDQEVSSVVRTTTSGIDSPTIRQRKMKTSVVVKDSETLALGGLIQERETTGKTKVPVLGDIPGVGLAFRNKTNAVSRTELIIFIRPRVMRDRDEARRVTAEFRRQLEIRLPRVRRGEPTAASEAIRIAE